MLKDNLTSCIYFVIYSNNIRSFFLNTVFKFVVLYPCIGKYFMEIGWLKKDPGMKKKSRKRRIKKSLLLQMIPTGSDRITRKKRSKL